MASQKDYEFNNPHEWFTRIIVLLLLVLAVSLVNSMNSAPPAGTEITTED